MPCNFYFPPPLAGYKSVNARIKDLFSCTVAGTVEVVAVASNCMVVAVVESSLYLFFFSFPQCHDAVSVLSCIDSGGVKLPRRDKPPTLGT